MRKGIRRAVLTVAFSAGMIFGAMGASDIIWTSFPADSSHTQAAPVDPLMTPSDIIWTSAPTGTVA